MTKSNITKKTLFASAVSLIMCFTMLLGTTYAWFTDSVTSTGNIIKSGNLKVEMQWAEGKEALNTASWTDASEGAIFNYDRWEPGYIDAKHIKVSNKGNLAFNYELRIAANGTVSKLAEVIDVYYFANAKQITRETASSGEYLGKLIDALGNAQNISRKIRGILPAQDDISTEVDDTFNTFTIALKMRESAGNEYQNLSIGSDFTVQLLATQATVESDSFDNQYDKDAQYPNEVLPSATLVRNPEFENVELPWGNFGGIAPTPGLDNKLEAAFTFMSQEDALQAAKSPYADWYCDYYVKLDRELGENQIFLGGNYGSFGWVGFHNGDQTLEANKEIPLMGTFMGSWYYKDIAAFVGEFTCGVGDVNDALAGATFTVMLRLTNPEDSNEYFDVATVNYTFDGDIIDEWQPLDVVNGDVTRQNQVAKDYVEISHKSGNLTLKNVTFENGLTIYTNEAENNGVITFEKCTINLSNGIKSVDGYNQCNADYGLNLNLCNGSDITFKFVNCTFTKKANHQYGAAGKGYNVYIGGGYSAKSISFEGCVFEGSGKHVIGCSSESGSQYYDLNVVGCNFVDWNNNPDSNNNGAAIRGNLPSDTFNANINISGNIFGNSNNSTQATVAIDRWTGSWN